jgi:hypothetical protein
MPSIAFEVLDVLERRQDLTPDQKQVLLAEVPAHQWALQDGHFDELSRHCCNRVEVNREPRFMNRLSINVMTPLPRCLYRSPDGRGLAWLKSGGEVEVYGRCEQARCERAKASPQVEGAN